MQLIGLDSALLIGAFTVAIPIIIEWMRIRDAKRKEKIEIRKEFTKVFLELEKLILLYSQQVDISRLDLKKIQLDEDIENFDYDKLRDNFENIKMKYYDIVALLATYSNHFKMNVNKKKNLLIDIESSIYEYYRVLIIKLLNKQIKYNELSSLNSGIQDIRLKIDKIPAFIIATMK